MGNFGERGWGISLSLVIINFDVRDRLNRIEVPTLLITPQDDKLVGKNAAQELLDGIAGAQEIVLPATGHMFRFTHPDLYGNTITAFIDDALGTTPREHRGAPGR